MENIQKLQHSFEQGTIQSISSRRLILKRLKQLISENEQLLIDSLYQDLGKNAYEAVSQELMLVYDELNFAIKNLKKYTKPRLTITSYIHFPAISKVAHKPYGTVLVISPWNYPIMLSLVPVIGALACGNSCILVPSSKSSNCEQALASILNQLDENILQVVTGSGSVIVPKLIEQYPIDYIFFTGGEEVGRKIATQAASKLIPYTLELGGKSPCIVDSSANLAVAARKIVWGKFINAGQVCVAPDYLIIDEKIEEQFIKLLTFEIENLFVEEAYGKIIDSKSVEHLSKLLKSEQIIYGGEANIKNRYFQPTLVKVTNMQSPLMTTEIFGPILPIITYSDFANVQGIINCNPTPLASYLYTNNKQQIKWFTEHLKTGAISINDSVIQISNNNLPFGGVGSSGNGAYHGKYSFRTFTYPQAILQTTTKFDTNIKYPPYSPFKKWLLKVAMSFKR